MENVFLSNSGFEFLDFSNGNSGRSLLKSNEVSLRSSEKGSRLNFNAIMSKEIEDRKLLKLGINRNIYTNEIYFVFNKDNGVPLTKNGSNTITLRANNKQLVLFLKEALNVNDSCKLILSKNLSKDNSVMTYKIVSATE